MGTQATVRRSATWAGPVPPVAVVVSSYRRSRYLPVLAQCLEAQDVGVDHFEVVIVDNGSGDDTWDVLTELATTTKLRLTVVRVEHNRGPGGGRNAGAREVRAPILVLTDDDCLPTPTWLGRMLRAFDGSVDVVQGRVAPDPEGLAAAGPWDHTIDIAGQTPWFETSNVAYRRRAFERVGGFDETDELTARQGGGRAFGEDAVLGWRVVASGGLRRFAASAVVHHRVVPDTFRHLVHEWRAFADFPGLVQRSGLARESLHLGVFLNRRTAAYDLAVVAVAAAALSRRPLLALGALPWARSRWPWARQRAESVPGTVVRLAQRAVIEGTGLVSLLQGSARHRRLVL